MWLKIILLLPITYQIMIIFSASSLLPAVTSTEVTMVHATPIDAKKTSRKSFGNGKKRARNNRKKQNRKKKQKKKRTLQISSENGEIDSVPSIGLFHRTQGKTLSLQWVVDIKRNLTTLMKGLENVEQQIAEVNFPPVQQKLFSKLNFLFR